MTEPRWTAMRALVRRHGALPLALALAAISIVASVALTLVLGSSFITAETRMGAIGIATAVPLLLAFPICWLLLSLLRRLDDAEREQRGLAEELARAAQEVRELEGLLPVCASCKGVRDDEGYWHELEQFLRVHSRARVSHSLCPGCVRRLYPDHADDTLSGARRRGSGD